MRTLVRVLGAVAFGLTVAAIQALVTSSFDDHVWSIAVAAGGGYLAGTHHATWPK